MVTKIGDSGIWSWDLNFKNFRRITRNLAFASGMVRSGNKIYWIEADVGAVGLFDRRIKRANLNGSNVEVLMRVDAEHLAIDAAGKKLYWLSGGDVWRSNINGKNRQKVASDIYVTDEFGFSQGFALGNSIPIAAAPMNMDASPPPGATTLLPNYPNPFNPETWIPYELATDMDVRITIYNAQGVVIRTLELGQQSAGYYTTRSRAAHWDGRNNVGEPVASGVYFYTLTAGDFTATRKLLIRK